MNPPEHQRQALIVTGEASGDLHGANLIRAAREIDPGLSFFGVGGQRMREAGCDILIPAEDLAVMGLVEVIGRFPVIRRAFNILRRVLRGDRRPDLVILIDYPGFNLRVAAAAKRVGIPVLYYISPKVWAWRPGRVRTIARVVDRLAVIFPFEPELFRGTRLAVEYVGNPLLDEFHQSCTRDQFLHEYGLNPASPVVGLFPGSRPSEIKFIFDTILRTAAWVHRQRPAVQFLLPVAASLDRVALAAQVAGSGLPVLLVEDNIYDVAGACDAVLCVSGTVTLQVALAGTPLTILYKAAPLTYAIGRRVIQIPHFGLPNIVAGREVVKEFLQDAAVAENLGPEIMRLLDDMSYREKALESLAEVSRRLGGPGCSERVARMASAMSRGEEKTGGGHDGD
jgi:lipid-A-disaccharide synthase